jgi:hypothetical protein
MEPIQSASESAERVADEVVPSHVCKLVKQNCQTAIRGPVIALGGKNDGRRDDATRERHSRVVTPQQAWRLVETKSVGDFIEWCEPVLRVERTSSANHSMNDERAVRQPGGEGNNHNRP